MTPGNISTFKVIEMAKMVVILLAIELQIGITDGRRSYCSNLCTSKCDVLPLCTNITSTAPSIYFDSTGTQANTDTNCSCVLYHDFGTNYTFFLISLTNGGPGLEIDIDGKIFNETIQYRRLLRSGTVVRFRQSGFTLQSKLCLGISTGFDGPNMSVSCFQSHYEPPTTTDVLPRTSTFQYSTMPPHLTSVTLNTTTETPLDNRIITITGYSGGAVGVIVIVAIVTLCIIYCRKYKHRGSLTIQENVKPTLEDPVYSLDVTSTYTYIDNDSLFRTQDTCPNYDHVTSIVDPKSVDTGYACVNQPKKFKQNQRTNEESTYNHLNETKGRIFIGNLYDSLKT